MHLDGGLELRVMGIADVGITAADMRDHDAIFALQPPEEVVRGMRVGCLVGDVGRIGDLRMRGAVNSLALAPKVHIAVAADGRIGRPFVAGDADKSAGPVERARQPIQLGPERAGDLEVVALMAHHIEEGLVAAELEIFTRRIGAQRLVRLTVGVAPEMNERQIFGRDAQRIGAAQFVALVIEYADA